MPMWQSVQAMLAWVVLFGESLWQKKHLSDETAAPAGELRIRKKIMRIGIMSRIEQQRSETRSHNKYSIGFVKKKIGKRVVMLLRKMRNGGIGSIL